MALGAVQVGYRNSLYTYPTQGRTELERSYEEWLAELTTELELALESETDESVLDESTENDSDETESHSELKEEWEELLEQTDVVDAILRQMLENGLGQRKDEQQEQQESQSPDNLDNEFDIAGVPADSEGKSKDGAEYPETLGNSEFLQSNAGNGTAYWNTSNPGRRRSAGPHMICLFCETECDSKKQWKITE